MSENPHQRSLLLARYAPLLPEVQKMVSTHLPHLIPALASNSSLTPELWQDLYSSGVSAVTAERLLWRRGLTEAMLHHALVVRQEARKAPMAALLASGFSEETHAFERWAKLPLGRQSADLLMNHYSFPSALRPRVAARASYNVGSLYLLGDHRAHSDKVAYEILRGCSQYSQWGRHSWSLLPAMLIDRPRVRDMLARNSPAPVVAWAAARAGVGPAAQDAFVNTLVEIDLSNAGASSRIARALYTHPHTTAVTVARLEDLAKTHDGIRSGISDEAPRGWGANMLSLSNRRVNALLDDTYRFGRDVWVLTALGAHPGLSATQRDRLVCLLEGVHMQDVLSNTAKPALRRARSGSGELLPATSWRVDSKVGDKGALSNRLGERPGFHAPIPQKHDWCGEQRLAGMTSRYIDSYDLRQYGSHVAFRLEDNVAAWEVMFSLVDSFEGTVDDLADMALACVA